MRVQGTQARNIAPFKEDAPALGTIETVDAVEGDRLACTVRSDDGENFAAPHLKSDASERGNPAKREVNVFHDQLDFVVYHHSLFERKLWAQPFSCHCGSNLHAG